MTAPSPSPAVVFPEVHARKRADGRVIAYADREMTKEVKVWKPWASDIPDMRQRYVTIANIEHRILWHS